MCVCVCVCVCVFRFFIIMSQNLLMCASDRLPPPLSPSHLPPFLPPSLPPSLQIHASTAVGYKRSHTDHALWSHGPILSPSRGGRETQCHSGRWFHCVIRLVQSTGAIASNLHCVPRYMYTYTQCFYMVFCTCIHSVCTWCFKGIYMYMYMYMYIHGISCVCKHNYIDS